MRPFLFLIFWSLSQAVCGQAVPQPWKEASYQVLSAAFPAYPVAAYGNPFLHKKNSIIASAPELQNLHGIRIPLDPAGAGTALQLQFGEPVNLLVGISRDSGQQEAVFPAALAGIAGDANGNLKPVLLGAVTVTGIPAVDVYAIPFKKGRVDLTLPRQSSSPYLILGVVKASPSMSTRNVALIDGRYWDPFIVEGYYEDALFSVTGGPDAPMVDSGSSGAADIQGGFEGGACVKVGATYHLFPTERAGERGQEAAFDRVKTRIGHWTSPDAVHWKRQGTLYQASGNYSLTHDDNPLNDRRGAIWSYMPVWSAKANRWYGYYLAYTVDREISPNHSFGRIWRTESVTPGPEGIGGPYKDQAIIMEPGLDTQLWEGRQGVDSFFPYEVNGKWLGFYGGAYPYLKKEDYPSKLGKGWFVGLAESPSLEGPWKRLDTTVNPVTSIHPWFIENPIVSKLPNGLLIAIFDGGPEGWGHHLPNMMGYSLSKDGIKWSEAHYIPFSPKVKKWWTIMRTPLCLIPEGNGEYTVVYAAISGAKRFHPMGMVKMKLNTEVLAHKWRELE